MRVEELEKKLDELSKKNGLQKRVEASNKDRFDFATMYVKDFEDGSSLSFSIETSRTKIYRREGFIEREKSLVIKRSIGSRPTNSIYFKYKSDGILKIAELGGGDVEITLRNGKFWVDCRK